MYNENNNPFEQERNDFNLNEETGNDFSDFQNQEQPSAQNISWQSDSGFQPTQDVPTYQPENVDLYAQPSGSEGQNDYTYTPTVSTYYTSPKPPKKKSKAGKVILSFALCISLFAGAALGMALPQIFNNTDDGTSGRPTVNILQNKTSAGAQKTAGKGNKLTTGKELTTQEIAAAVGPAVVGIENMGRGGYYGLYGSEVTMGTGSGVVMTEDGYVITNYHVVEGSSKLKVIMSNGEEYIAKIIGADEESDLAVIKIDAKNLAHVTFGDSSAVTVGDKAIAIGNPLGNELMGTVTQGIISAVNRTVQIDNKTMTLLQTDAAINSGNSGGALINAYGEVIGINSAKMAASGVEGLGFAIPSNLVLDVVNDLIDYGYVRGKLTIGIGGTNITEKMASYYDLPMGFYVQEVYEGTGAAQAGIKPGDIIIKCDGKVVQNIDDINELKKKHKVGDTMIMEIVRNENKLTVEVVLQEEKPETAW